MLTRDLHFDLPDHLIATKAAEPRDASRLMVCNRQTNTLEHLHVRDLATREDLLSDGDLLVFNQTRVLPAFISGTRVGTGGKVTGLYLNATDQNHWQVMLESRGKLQPGEQIALTDDSHLTLLQRIDGGEWLVQVTSPLTTLELLQQVGSTPLPPYIRKARRQQGLDEITDEDQQRYNTVYAQTFGSVAAPTAGLHYTPELLKALTDRGIELGYVTLHVGMGTFMPVRTERVDDHPIHAEPITVTQQALAQLKRARQQGRRIVPVGTTTVRTLESLPENWQSLDSDYSANTSLYIYPDRADFAYRFTDAMMTNFHLPESTLLAMVATLPEMGLERLKNWYHQAIENEYRFYSYGDAMLIL
ncbi:MAG: tRNA preQ1(34) S-adenosylmethionine ribosyltransferase-isomerase QueA [Phycisphaeraceae bacterium JB051]